MMTNQKWRTVEHNWHQTSIYADHQRVCLLDTEDWGVDEDNQYQLEEEQKNLASLIVKAPEMLKLLQNIKNNRAVSDDTLEQITQLLQSN